MNFAVFSHVLLWGSLEPQRGSSNLAVILGMRIGPILLWPQRWVANTHSPCCFCVVWCVDAAMSPQTSTSASKLNNSVPPKRAGHEKHAEVSVCFLVVMGQFVRNSSHYYMWSFVLDQVQCFVFVLVFLMTADKRGKLITDLETGFWFS